MKKTVGISLFIFFVIVVAILVAGLVFYQNNKTAIPNNQYNNTSNNLNGSSSQKVLNMAEVVKHNQINDCYMVINNKVYDVTNYSLSHPGGTRTIANSCGKEATNTYDTKGGNNGAHSSYAGNLLDQYFVGNLAK